MTQDKIIKAIQDLLPEAKYVISGEDFDNITWLDERPKPTWEQVKTAINNPLPEKEKTIDEKLASVGLSLDELKAALLLG
jgi:hypothetical protein